MFSSSRLGNSSSHSRRLSNYTEGRFNLRTNAEFKPDKMIRKLNETPKVQFRKVLKQRNKHSRLGSDDDLQQRSVISNRSTRYYESSMTEIYDKEKDQESNKIQNVSQISQKDLFLRHTSNKNLNLNRSSSNLQNQKSRDDDKLPIINRKQLQDKQNVQDVIQQFLTIQSKIMRLIHEKWDTIEENLMKENQSSRVSKSRSRLDTNSKHSASFSIISEPNQMKNNSNKKFTFIGAVSQKKIDQEIMNEIKRLRSLNLSPTQVNKRVNPDQYRMLEDLQKRRADIVQKTLAQSMVESQLLKKYYSGQNAKGLSTSNHKVGQDNTKSKELLSSIKRIQNKEMSTIDFSQQRSHHRRGSVIKQSENKLKFVPPNEEDYESYRYKHPQFKANMQPLPRSSYKSHFFDYSNVPIGNEKYKQQKNIIFPLTSTLKPSLYRNDYRMFSPQRVNYKELDAYQDKFKPIDILYLPKKRSQSEACNLRKVSKVNKFMDQIDYVKRLKTESIVGKTQTPKILPSKFFGTESKNQYQNPEKLYQHLEKSQIKHKNLYTLKYDMKKKFHV